MLNIKNMFVTTNNYKKNLYFFIIIGLIFIIKLICITYNSLLVEEAYYWNYSQHLDFGYLDHPPMVALLIKFSTFIFGLNEFAVRFSTLVCWLIAVFFNMKLSELIKPGTGKYVLLLLSILPFFFLHSLIITPDAPLIACWSAALYYLYQALVLDKPTKWYMAGFWLGLGMLSKYTIVLLGGSAFIYIISISSARKWLLKKEPYICVLIILLLFTPVIYWNFINNWASFAFQGGRRFSQSFNFSFYDFIGLLILFLMPVGIAGLWFLIRVKSTSSISVKLKAARFLQVFTIVPLLFFGLFSLFHDIKFNWIGPGLLALTPWLAVLLSKSAIKPLKQIFNLRNSWLISSFILIIFYSLMTLSLTLGQPDYIQQKLFIKYIDWQDFSAQVNVIASKVKQQKKSIPLILPLDVYNISSELNFYQKKLLQENKIKTMYPVVGQHVVGLNSLMYKYWRHENPTNRLVILISDNINSINHQVNNKLTHVGPVKTFYSHSKDISVNLRPFFYRTALLN